MVHYWTIDDTKKHWLTRKEASHKGSNGKIGIVAGSDSMPGAAVLVTRAAVNAGAGLTFLNTTRELLPIVAANVNEATYYFREDGIEGFMNGKDAIAIGPGLGKTDDTHEAVRTLAENFDHPLVIDADGLFRLSELKESLNKKRTPVIITPHVGEMARILNTTPEEVDKNKVAVARDVAGEFNVHVVLKSHETVYAAPYGPVCVNTSGNAGLAKGGSGDVLTGMVASFLGQNRDERSAVMKAVFMHGYTADFLVENGAAVDTITPTMLINNFHETFTSMGP